MRPKAEINAPQRDAQIRGIQTSLYVSSHPPPGVPRRGN